MNARFNLPDFFLGQPIYAKVMDYLQSYPEIVYPHTEISAIFGNFHGAIWNGGGYDIGSNISTNEMEDCIAFYNYELHLPLRFTFTNCFITENQCFDTYCNLIATAGHNGHNQILVTSPVLERYLRQHYPNYKYCRSIIAARDVPYDLKNGDYFLSVMRRSHNNDWEYLDTIPEVDRPSIEFLCNDPCPDNCPRIYTHYRDLARSQLEGRVNDEHARCSMEDVKGRFQAHYTTTLRAYISREMIDTIYLPKGYCEFKLSGRNNPLNMINNVLEYLIIPEYRSDITVELFGDFVKW